MNFKPDVFLHYSPESGVFGDPIPFFWKGEYHIFYQNSPGEFSFNKMRWGHIKSRDLIYWKSLPDALVPEPDSPDAYGCWTESIIQHKNRFHIFYTGCAGQDGRSQTICHATSENLITWDKDKLNPIITPFAPFSNEPKSAWRDPLVIQDGSKFRMIITAEMSKFPVAFNGCLIEFQSDDLQNWKFERILFMPVDSSKIECPDLFKINKSWLLFYSDNGVKVRWSKNGRDHWENTNPHSLDNFRYYAAKTLLDDQERRLCFGFVSDREEKNDSSSWKWGGILAFPRQISLKGDDQLFISPIDELKKIRKEPVKLNILPSSYTLGEWILEKDTLIGSSVDNHSGLSLLLGKQSKTREIKMTFDLTECNSGNLLFYSKKDYSEGYRLEIDMEEAELKIARLVPKKVIQSVYLQYFMLPDNLDRIIDMDVIIDHTLIEIYINNRYCYSGRIYPEDPKANWWGFYSNCGSLKVNNLKVWDLALNKNE
jgi:beta-fructofuranosidase